MIDDKIAQVQHMSAIKVKADCMVTRNKKDFRKSVIPVYTIDELMSLMARLTHSLLGIGLTAKHTKPRTCASKP